MRYGEKERNSKLKKKYLEDAIISTEKQNQNLEVPLTRKCPSNKSCLYQDDPVSMGLNWLMVI